MEPWRLKLRAKYAPRGSIFAESVSSEGAELFKYKWGKNREPIFEVQKSTPFRYAWGRKATDTKPPRSDIQEIIHEEKTEERKQEVVQENLKITKGKYKVL